MKQSIQPLHASPSREPLSRLWFLARDYHPIDPTLVHGRIFYIRAKDGEVSILDANGQKGYIEFTTNEKWRVKNGHCKPYYCLKFWAGGRTYHVRIALLVMATFNHKVPDRSKGEVIDHIDGNTLNNDSSNLRIVTRQINDRDGGFMRKLRNNGYDVTMYPDMILEGYARMAEWKDTHTHTQYQNLQGQALLRVFFGHDHIPTVFFSDLKQAFHDQGGTLTYEQSKAACDLWTRLTNAQKRSLVYAVKAGSFFRPAIDRLIADYTRLF